MVFFTSRGFYWASLLASTQEIRVQTFVPGDLEALREYMPELALQNPLALEGSLSRNCFAAGLTAIAADIRVTNFVKRVAADSGPQRLPLVRKLQDLLRMAPELIKEEQVRIETVAELKRRQLLLFPKLGEK